MVVLAYQIIRCAIDILAAHSVLEPRKQMCTCGRSRELQSKRGLLAPYLKPQERSDPRLKRTSQIKETRLRKNKEKQRSYRRTRKTGQEERERKNIFLDVRPGRHI